MLEKQGILERTSKACDMNAVHDDHQSDTAERSAPDADPRPAVSVLIVGYNTKDLLMDCLDGLFKHTHGVDFEVLYADCSDDGSVQAVREKFPAVRVIDNDENLGYGRGNNFLARHARGEYLLLLNPDTLVRDNAVGALYDCAREHPEAGAWGGETELPDGNMDPGCKQTGPGLRFLVSYIFGMSKLVAGGLPNDASEAAPVATLTGAFMMVQRDLWDRLGGFDESFFMYCEEMDLCYRIKQAGHDIVMTPKARIVHLVGSGSGQSPARMIALSKGATHFNRKHFGKLYTAVDIVLRWFYSFTRYALGVIGMPLVGRERARTLRNRHLPIITRPCQWTKGWS